MADRRDDIDELFAELWQVPRFSGLRRGFRPNVDCFHTDDRHALTVVVELPGVDPDAVTLVAAERTLLVQGERARPKADDRVYQQVEIEYGPFRREVRLGEDVDPERATARYERGVLTVTLPVAEKPPPRGRVAIAVKRA